MPNSTDFPAHLTPEERAGLKKLYAACLAFNQLYPAPPKRSGTPLNLENVDFDRLRLSLDRLAAERERDRAEARRLLEERVRTHGAWFHRKTAVMILPDNAATETVIHETFHAMSIAAKLSMLAQGTPYDDAHHQLKDAFDAYLDRVQSASARPDWHAFYRETMYPVFSRDESTGPEEIFARVDAGIHGDLAAVAEEDIKVMEERGYPVPADYPAIVKFCLTEIRDSVVRDFGSGRSFLEHTILSFGASLPDAYLASSL